MMSLEKQLKQKTTTLEHVIFEFLPDVELCDLNCGHICEARNECPFRDVKYILEIDDVLEMLGVVAERVIAVIERELVDLRDKTLAVGISITRQDLQETHDFLVSKVKGLLVEKEEKP